jgi:hypothetical protein
LYKRYKHEIAKKNDHIYDLKCKYIQLQEQ